MNEYALTLDLAKAKQRQQQTIFVRQGDKNATTIVATITDHGVAASTSGMTARFSMRLPNGTEYYRKAASLSGNTATVTIDETQAASAVGRTDVAYFQLLQGSTVVASTESFTVVVLPDALADATVPESYDSAIQDAINALDDAVEQLPSTVEDVLTAHPEWTTTVQDGSITKAKLATDLARDRERLLYRLDNLLTNALPEGDVATATDAAKTPVAELALYGRSTQDGTPTPSAPVPIVSVEGNLQSWPTTGGRAQANVTIEHTAGMVDTVTASAAATANVWALESAEMASHVRNLPAGTYTASCPSNFRLMVRRRDGSSWSNIGANVASPYTFTLDAAADVCVFYSVPSGTAAGTYEGWVALYAGSTAYPYVPYGNAGLWARGKNLASVTRTLGTINGITVAQNADGSLKFSGTATAQTVLWMNGNSGNLLSAGQYTASAEGMATGLNLQVAYKMSESDSLTYAFSRNYDSSDTFTIPESTYTNDWRIVVASEATVNTTVRFQIERGSTATAYQPYEQTFTPVPLDGHELRSLPDGTRDELTVDAEGHAVLVQRVGFQHVSEFTSVNNELAKTPLEGGRDNVRWAESVCICDKLVNNTSASASDAMRRLQNVIKAARNSGTDTIMRCVVNFDGSQSTLAEYNAKLAEIGGIDVLYPLETPVTHDLGTIDPVPLVGPDLTAQAVPSAPMQLTYERDLDTTLARLESAIANLV